MSNLTHAPRTVTQRRVQAPTAIAPFCMRQSLRQTLFGGVTDFEIGV
jgi:hypothetical protein